MDFNRLTEKVQEAVQAAQSKAVRLSHQQIDVEHLLAALIEQENGLAPSLLLKAGVGSRSDPPPSGTGARPPSESHIPNRRARSGLHHRSLEPPVHGSRRRSQAPQR